MDSALDTDQAKTVAIVAIVAIVVIGILLTVIINKLVGRLVVAVIVIGAGVFFWYQRSTIEDHIDHCDTSVSFLGIHLNLSQSVKDHCAQITGR